MISQPTPANIRPPFWTAEEITALKAGQIVPRRTPLACQAKQRQLSQRTNPTAKKTVGQNVMERL